MEAEQSRIDPAEQAITAAGRTRPVTGLAVILPENQLRAGTRSFLDDETVEGLSLKTGIPILTTPPDAGSLLTLLDNLPELYHQNSRFKKGDVPS